MAKKSVKKVKLSAAKKSKMSATAQRLKAGFDKHEVAYVKQMVDVWLQNDLETVQSIVRNNLDLFPEKTVTAIFRIFEQIARQERGYDLRTKTKA
jgi:hypothetical protein